ncbi:hypothetical protein BpHYR1_018174 [Brachionus plicatilis]|uniref:Uncharacterized protein n=1 Tax=Brachionus plicatilis TaxID=10195 RepID=A0A3M7SHC4_BRAPC|nr:hypothetical protein BpHYR1_018174 [Brachionus plicatilis]
MSALAFTKYYENLAYDEKFIQFNRFAKLNLIRQRVKLNTNFETSFNIAKAKDCFVSNLCINESFLENDRFTKDSFNKIYNFLKSPKHDETALARSIFLVHLSKSSADYLIFGLFFKIFDSIDLVKPYRDVDINHELNFLYELFLKLKHNRVVQEIILKTVQSICGQNVHLNFNELKMFFFKCSIEKLRGFAGIGRIYVGYRPFLNMLKELTNFFPKEDARLIIKLEFLRIFVNLATQSMIRSVKNDLNYWNPKLFGKYNQVNKKYRLNIGNKAEENLFRIQINWFQSGLKGTSLKLDQWKQFYKSLITDLVRPDHIKSEDMGIINKNNQNFLMGIDFF